MTVSDALYVAEIPAAQELVRAVRAQDEDAIRDVLTGRSETHLWALILDLAAMVTDAEPDPERVLEYCCDVDTRLAYSAHPDRWSMEDLQTALCVHAARTDPGARWVERGVLEHQRRRKVRDAAIRDANAQALAVRADEGRTGAGVGPRPRRERSVA